MKIHTFEKKISLAEFYSEINKIIKSDFKIDDNSYINELNLLIIGINVKEQSIIIRGSIDKSKNRIYLSLLALHSNVILKELNTTNTTNASINELGKILFETVKIGTENEKSFVFSNLAIKKPIERKIQTQLVETENEILIKLLGAFEERDNNSIFLRKYPFSLIEMDGSWEIWQKFYSPYIDLVESKLSISKSNSLWIFRNYDFAFSRAFHQRIADLIISEIEDEISNPSSKRLGNNFKKLYEKIEDQYSDEVEKENKTLKITFIFSNKKKQQLKLIQMLKLTGEVKKFTHLLHEKIHKKYSKIEPQIIFISLFGFENTVGDYLRDNLYGNHNKNLSILIVPPMNNNLWNNYFIKDSIESQNDLKKHNSGINYEDYNKLRRNGAANQIQVKEMETYYKDLFDVKKISDNNSQQIKNWADLLSINDSFSLLDIEKSREKIKTLVIE